MVLIFFLVCYLVYFIVSSLPLSFPRFKLSPSTLDIFYGAPGSGKTSLCAWYAIKCAKQGIPCYSNVPIKGTLDYQKADIGHYAITDGLMLIDESGLFYNNRSFKTNFDDGALNFFKKHRHEGVHIMMFSQDPEDADLKLRQLATRIWLVRKSLIPYFITVKRIKKTPGISEDKTAFLSKYDFVPFSTKRIFAPSTWSYFDSYDRMKLPAKMFHIHGTDDWEEVTNYNLSIQGVSPSSGRKPEAAEHHAEGVTFTPWHEFVTSTTTDELGRKTEHLNCDST